MTGKTGNGSWAGNVSSRRRCACAWVARQVGARRRRTSPSAKRTPARAAAAARGAGRGAASPAAAAARGTRADMVAEVSCRDAHDKAYRRGYGVGTSYSARGGAAQGQQAAPYSSMGRARPRQQNGPATAAGSASAAGARGAANAIMRRYTNAEIIADTRARRRARALCCCWPRRGGRHGGTPAAQKSSWQNAHRHMI